jgi:hypothetical protein
MVWSAYFSGASTTDHTQSANDNPSTTVQHHTIYATTHVSHIYIFYLTHSLTALCCIRFTPRHLQRRTTTTAGAGPRARLASTTNVAPNTASSNTTPVPATVSMTTTTTTTTTEEDNTTPHTNEDFRKLFLAGRPS